MTDSDRETRRVRNLVRQHWNRRAATFDEAPEHGLHSDAQRRRWLEVLGEWTGEPPRRVLDVGCGTGVLSLLLAELGHDVTGIDAAPAMVERARRKATGAGHSVRFGLGDATRLGVTDDAVDLVVERHLLWTLPDPAGAIDEWRRVVQPGGRLVLFEGRWNREEVRGEYAQIHEDLPMYSGRSGAALRDRLAAAGLVDVTAESLTDPVLRGREPGTDLPHDYVVVAGTVPV